MRIVRLPIEGLVEGVHALPAEAAVHASRVLRLGPGARFVAFDPARAVECEAELVEVGKRGATARFAAPRPAARAERDVTVVQAIGKGDKLDAVVRDATELGATRVAPAIAERSVRRPRAGGADERAGGGAARVSRWARVAIEAARQCGRGDAPRVDDPRPLLDVLASLAPSDGLGALLHPGGDAAFGALLSRLDARAPVVVVIGPEGGFSDGEIEAALALGYVAARLGPFVLRTETACAAALGAVLAAARA